MSQNLFTIEKEQAAKREDLGIFLFFIKWRLNAQENVQKQAKLKKINSLSTFLNREKPQQM